MSEAPNAAGTSGWFVAGVLAALLGGAAAAAVPLEVPTPWSPAKVCCARPPERTTPRPAATHAGSAAPSLGSSAPRT